jgi:nitrate reductase gamma subunit
MSEFLQFLEDEVQIVALSFLGIVYILRIIWLFRFHSRKERSYPMGNARAGIAVSLLNVAMPWAMESTRKRPGFYLQFILFHLAVTAAISVSFIIPYWPELFEIKTVVLIFQGVVGAGIFVGVLRFFRRILNPRMRLISTADDYFSLLLMILFFAAAFWAIPNNYEAAEWPLIIFFALTALLLIYVPFSKIGHYLYYPFTRYFLGRTMGHRGVFLKSKRIRVSEKEALKGVPK